MKYCIYLRVSTDLQDVRTQEQHCLRFIQDRHPGKKVEHKIYSDPDVSSGIKMEKREQLMNMLNELKRGDQVVVFLLDRLSRDHVEMMIIRRMIKKKKCVLHSVSESHCDDEFMVGIMGLMAQKERQLIKHRITAKLHSKKERGERVSRWLPYGYELHADGTHLAPICHEQEVLSLMRAMLAEGKTYRGIAQELERQGYRNRQGKPFHYPSIYRILCRTGQTTCIDQPLEATK